MEPIRSQELGPFGEALASVKRAKNFFWWILLLCLLVQLAGFVLVRFTHLILIPPGQAAAATPAQKVDIAPAESAGKPTTAPATQSAAGDQKSSIACAGWIEPSLRERPWYFVFRYMLPATMFLCVIVGLLLILTLMWMVKLALLARASGIEGYLGAFFWSLVFWVLIVPWQHVMHAEMLAGATFNLGDLMGRTCDIIYGGSSRIAQIFYYCRFAVYPVIAILILLIIQSKFSAGYKRMTYSASSTAGTTTTPTAPPKL